MLTVFVLGAGNLGVMKVPRVYRFFLRIELRGIGTSLIF